MLITIAKQVFLPSLHTERQQVIALIATALANFVYDFSVNPNLNLRSQNSRFVIPVRYHDTPPFCTNDCSCAMTPTALPLARSPMITPLPSTGLSRKRRSCVSPSTTGKPQW